MNRILTPYWGRDNNRDSISETAYVFDLTDTDGDAKILDHMSTHYITPNTSYRNRTLSLDRDNWILFDKERMTFIKDKNDLEDKLSGYTTLPNARITCVNVQDLSYEHNSYYRKVEDSPPVITFGHDFADTFDQDGTVDITIQDKHN